MAIGGKEGDTGAKTARQGQQRSDVPDGQAGFIAAQIHMHHAIRQVFFTPLIHPAAGEERKADDFMAILRALLPQRSQPLAMIRSPQSPYDDDPRHFLRC